MIATVVLWIEVQWIASNFAGLRHASSLSVFMHFLWCRHWARLDC